MTHMSKPARFAQFQGVHEKDRSLLGAQGTLSERPPMRRYHVKSLGPNGLVTETSQIGPAHPFFEDAFSAFARGSMIDTESGPVAVEDLLPGDRIVTAVGPALPVMWIGKMTCSPGFALPDGRSMTLTRVSADCFGLGRPEQFLVAGPGARIARLLPDARDTKHPQYGLTRLHRLRDGHQIVETTPPGAVDLFHLCLPRHSIVRVSGLECETYHPGAAIPFENTGLRAAFLSMFPHVRHVSQFGPLAGTRASEEDVRPVQPSIMQIG